MTTIKCSIDKINSFNQKPERNMIPKIQESILNGQSEYTVIELANYIERGHSFCPSVFKELNGKISRKNENWAGTQIIALDFDGGLSLEDFKSICKEFSIDPTFIYYTFSHHHSEKDKFRAVYVLNAFIEDMRIFNFIQKALSVVFDNNQDAAAKDPARLFYGASSLASDIDLNKLLHIEDLPQMVYAKLKRKCPSQFSREMKTFCQETALNQVNNTPAVFVENALTSIYNTKEMSTNSTNMGPIKITTLNRSNIYFHFSVPEDKLCLGIGKKKSKKYKVENQKVKFASEQRVKLNELANKCQLVQSLEEGAWLYHDEITHLGMNFVHARGGKKKLIDSLYLNENHIASDKPESFKIYCQFFTNSNYQPSRCKPRGIGNTGCRFFNSCDRSGVNILQQLDVKKGKIKRVKNEVKIPLIEGETKLVSAFSEAIAAPIDGTIHVIKGPTGIGKSRLYSTNSLENCAIAVPNHRLANEIYKTIKSAQPDLNLIYVPEKPQTTPELDNQINSLYQLGLYNKASQLFSNYARLIKTGKKEPLSKDHRVAIEEYERITGNLCTASTIIVTHERLMLLKDLRNIETVIIDEDIIQTVVRTKTITSGDLNFVYDLCLEKNTDQSSMKAFFDSVKLSPFEQYRDTPSNTDIIKTLANKISKLGGAKLKSNIIDFLSSTHFIKHKDGSITYVCNRSNFPLNKRYIMLSATTSQDMINSIWKNRVSFHDIGSIKTEGRVILHHNRSYSRSSLETLNFREFSKQLELNHTDDLKVITFKKYAHQFQSSGFEIATTFGSTTGLNQFEGEDLIIVGTPHFPPCKYILTALTLNLVSLENSNNDQFLQTIKVDRNEFQFQFCTFENSETLRNIQFYFIESELVQAIGRSRLLRNNATVHLYSNYPVPGCILLGEITPNNTLIAS